MSGRLVIFSGPSGVGKDTILEYWHAADSRVQRVVAYTTRPPRAGEADGVDYHFVSVPTFEAAAAQGAFLEHKQVHGNYYATPLHDMEAMLAAGKLAILKIDVQGALEAMQLRPEAATVFIAPPSLAELEHRIRERGLDDEAAIEKRLRNARLEMAAKDRYEHILVNENGSVDLVVAQLRLLFP